MALILEKDKLIESIWEYRWYILQYRKGFVAKIIRKTQYKETRGKHKEIQPRDIIKAKRQGLPEWLQLKRGYKGIFKWYVEDYGAREELPKEIPRGWKTKGRPSNDLNSEWFKSLPKETQAYWVNDLNTFEYEFKAGYWWDLVDFQTISELSYDNLVKLNYALITWLSRNQPLKQTHGGMINKTFLIPDEDLE